MTDFVFMVKHSGFMFITGPDVIRAVTGEETTQEELGGAMAHNTKSGNAHFACEDDQDCIDKIKDLLTFLPSNNTETPPYYTPTDDPHRLCPNLNCIIPDNPKMPYDIKDVIHAVVDDNAFFEVHAYYATNIVVGYARLNGRVVGIVANQPKVLAGCLDIDASDKGSRFIRTCDAFNIPLITFVDVPGYLPGTQQEWNGIIRHGAKLLWVYSEATVPKLTVVTRKNYGGSYIAMSSKHLGADMVFAWPTAEIAVMGAQGAANIIYRKEIQEAPDPAAKKEEKINEYEELFSNPYRAAERGYIDAVIRPAETRSRLIDALDAMANKTESLPWKKHGNVPL
jgi:acetyl-CoA carboxylase carboxyltransferase component